MASRVAFRRWPVTGIALAAVVLGANARALAGADLELGRYLASECMTCHRAQTTASSDPEHLSQVPRTHFVEVIKAYRDKQLPNPVMQNVAGRLKDDEIEALALYFATDQATITISGEDIMTDLTRRHFTALAGASFAAAATPLFAPARARPGASRSSS